MFHRKKATPGKFMIRLRIPNGIINSDHMRYFSTVVSKYGPGIICSFFKLYFTFILICISNNVIQFCF